MSELIRIPERWLQIQKNIERVTQGQRTVRVIGAAKYQPERRIAEAIQCGLMDLGVNYAQDGEILREQFSALPVQWHFIGHIQSRKVKFLVNYDWIHSLDRIEIAEALNGKLRELNKSISVLIEVNIGNEEAKSGIAAEALEGFVDKLDFSQIVIRGLMCMPPPLAPEARRAFFQKAHELFLRLGAGRNWDTLSMGTSEDYEVAIEEGATMVRLGSTLFGERVG